MASAFKHILNSCLGWGSTFFLRVGVKSTVHFWPVMFPRVRLGARHLCNNLNTQLVAETKHAQSPASSAGLFASQNLTNVLYTSTILHGVTSQKELSPSPPTSRTFHSETSSRVRHERAVDVFVTSSLTIYERITFRHSNAGGNSNK
jgi:hypothetical protein